MFSKESRGRVDAMWPLVSGVAVLMGRQSNRKERRMNTATRYRANVRRIKRHPNAIRADRAELALAFYQLEVVKERGSMGKTVIADLLTDLRHYCDHSQQDFTRLDRMAHRNYLNERYSG